MSQEQKKIFKLKHSITKIEKNLKSASESLNKNEQHEKEITSLVQVQKGFAKKELLKVLKKSQSHIKELKDHIKEGSNILS